MKISEPVLLDSNILVYAHNRSSPFHKKCLELAKSAAEGGIQANLAHQNLLEFYSVITNPRRIENPISYHDARKLVANYYDSPFLIIYPTPETFEIALKLASVQAVKNSKIFDVYLAATMLSNDISTIITANAADFKGFPDIRIIDLKSL